jgi:hypothetical protein
MPKNAVGTIDMTLDHQQKPYPTLGSIAFQGQCGREGRVSSEV